MKKLNQYMGVSALAFAANKGAEAAPAPETENGADTSADPARPQDGEDVTEDNTRLVGLANTITLATISCKPKPSYRPDGSVETVNYGSEKEPNIRVKYVDQDLCIMAGRATSYCFVETANGTSLELVGDFQAEAMVPDHNGEVGQVTRGPKIILPAIAQKILIAGVEAQGLPIGMFGEVTKNGETSTSRTSVLELKSPILFGYIIQAKGAGNAFGYQYAVKAVEKAKVENSPTESLMSMVRKKAKVLALAAPGSKHAQ
ncbi:MAG: hypothetical protein V4563_17215 [Pseudomonadota bacterium]